MSSALNPTRGKILNAAVSLLEEGGGSGVRMSDIAKAAGVSRQAVYLHFPNRAELLIAATLHVDAINRIDEKLAPSRSATGVDRLDKWIVAWGNHIPAIYGVAKAILAMKDTDEEAALAWKNRMDAVRHGCDAAINALADDGLLTPSLSKREATDLLWSLLSVRVWEQLRHECGWSQQRYLKHMQTTARAVLLAR